MGSLNGDFLKESVNVRVLDGEEGSAVATATAEVVKLRQPWIADEGPLAADFWRHSESELPRPLEMRGLAFDDRTTVQWDEDSVQVIEPAPFEPDVLARKSKVLVRDRFQALGSVQRIDYLQAGVLIASRYLPGPSKGEADA